MTRYSGDSKSGRTGIVITLAPFWGVAINHPRSLLYSRPVRTFHPRSNLHRGETWRSPSLCHSQQLPCPCVSGAGFAPERTTHQPGTACNWTDQWTNGLRHQSCWYLELNFKPTKKSPVSGHRSASKLVLVQKLCLCVFDTRSIAARRRRALSLHEPLHTHEPLSNTVLGKLVWICPRKREETTTHASIWYVSSAHILGAHANKQPFDLFSQKLWATLACRMYTCGVFSP